MDINKLAIRFERIVNKYNARNNKANDFGTGIILYRSEIHTIDLIGENNDINITRLAKLLGVTKGAVSQNVDKLIKKGMVKKELSPATENEVVLSLSKLGWTAFKKHKEFHKEFYEKLGISLNDVTEVTLKSLLEIADSFENYLDEGEQ